MVDAKVIHFGNFVRHRRGGMSRAAFASRVEILDAKGNRKGLTEKRLWQIEKMPDAEGMFPRTFNGLAAAMGMTPDELDAAWRATPVPVPAEDGRDFEGLPIRNARAVVAWADALVGKQEGAREGLIRALADGFAGREASGPEEEDEGATVPLAADRKRPTRSYQAPVPLTPLQRQQIEAVAKQAKGGGARGDGGRP